VVYGTLIAKAGIFFGLAVYGIVEGLSFSFVAIMIVAGVLYVSYLWCARSKIELTATLIEQSIVVLRTHPALFLVAAVLLVLSLIAYVAVLASAYTLLFGDGEWVYEAYTGTCEWDYQPWQWAGFLITIIFALWVFELFFAIRFATVSLVTGVWYYDYISLAASEEDSLAPAAASYLKTQTRRAPVATALKLSCTTSFGTMCVASLIITIAEILKRMARQQARNGLLGLLIACCLTCILSYLEFLTRFAISFHALTGESFCDSARTFTDHCSRHGFTALSVDVLSSIVLRVGAVVLSRLIGAITAGAVAGRVEEVAFPTGGYERTIFVLLFGVLGFAIALLPLMFAAGIILNVIDASYACLVLDLEHGDASAVCKPQLAVAIVTVAKPTNIVIQQPGGGPPVIAIAQPVSGGPQYDNGIPLAQQTVSYGASPVATPVGYPVAAPPNAAFVAPRNAVVVAHPVGNTGSI